MSFPMCKVNGCLREPVMNEYCYTHLSDSLKSPVYSIFEFDPISIINATKPMEANRNGRRKADKQDGESSGLDVNYYLAKVEEPRRGKPAYEAECEDIIRVLGMDFAEGTAFKSIWRKAAQRTLGLKKRGSDDHGVRDAEKVVYYGTEMLADAKRKAKKQSEDSMFPPIDLPK